MKCRLYPNKDAASMIDRIIHGVEKAYNIATYDMVTNNVNTIEFTTDKGGILHYPDYKKMTNAKYLDWLRTQHEDIPFVPSYALSGQSGVFMADHKKAMSHKAIIKKTADGRIKKTHDKQARKSAKGGYKPYSIEEAYIGYYNKNKRRQSYTYQISLKSAISFSDNDNVFYITLGAAQGTKVKHKIKVRGWNKEIRFDEYHAVNFLDYVKYLSGTKKTTVTVSRDNCGDYWICFKLSNIYKPMTISNGKSCGLDLGLKDLIIVSDGTKYENKRFKKEEKEHIAALNKRMSRRQGWSNEEFREKHKADKTLTPSKRYERTKLKLAKLNRKIAFKRNTYNNTITKDIVANHGFIGIETLNVSGMFRNKHLAYSLSDAAMSSVMSMLKYKSNWYGRIIEPIDQWTPSSKRCHSCGYIMPKMPLNIRKWKCPKCKVSHDRDVNAALNILFYATEKISGNKAA